MSETKDLRDLLNYKQAVLKSVQIARSKTQDDLDRLTAEIESEESAKLVQAEALLQAANNTSTSITVKTENA